MNEEAASSNRSLEVQQQLVAPTDSLHSATSRASADALVPVGSSLPSQGDLSAQREFLWKVHRYINDYIRFADAKAGFSVGIASALLWVLFAAKCNELFVTVAPIQWTPLAWVSLGSFLLLVTSILTAVVTIRPRLWTYSPEGFIFWQSIAQHEGPETFTAVFQAQKNEDLNAHLAHHLYTLGKICDRKYLWVNVAILAGAMGALLGIIVLLLKH